MYSTSAAKNSDTSKPLTVTKVLNFIVVKQRDEIIQADKLAGETKRIDALQRVPQRFARRPDKKDNGDNELRRDQQIGQPARAEHRTG